MPRPVSQRLRWILAVLQVVILLSTFAIPAAAEVTQVPPTPSQSTQLLQAYGIVKGDNTGNLNLDKPIKRAEMITIMVRAMGKESEALPYKGWGQFKDVAGHWAEANIVYAASKGLVKGDGDGFVRPEDYISYGEALTLILRMVGKEPTSGEWPLNILIQAIELRVLPIGITAGDIRQNAVRGLIFHSMALSITTIEATPGKTFLQTYVDSTPPKVTLKPLQATTKDQTVRVEGTVQDATSVTVNGVAASLTGNIFYADVKLEYGTNQISVVAYDLARNSAPAETTVTRMPPIASLAISGPDKVRPGGNATYAVSAKDSDGKAVALAGVTANVSGNIGAFNLTTGLFTASNTPGKGKIALTVGTVSKSIDVEIMGQNTSATRLSVRQINAGRSVPFTKPMTVEVEVRDAAGSFLNTDYGRPVTLTATGLSGLTVTPALAYTEAGVATFVITGTNAGAFNVTTTTPNLVSDTLIATFGTNLHVSLSSDPGALIVGGTTTLSRIRAELRDENNNLTANNTANDILVTLTLANSDGYLTDTTIRIGRGQTSSAQSGDEGLYRVGVNAGSATIYGIVTSGQILTVDPVSVAATVPSVGSGTRLEVFGPLLYLTPNAEATYVVRIVDSNGSVIPYNSYAFQLQVDTSNNEPKTNGIPSGVNIQLGSTGLNPVYDGIAEGATNDTGDVIARTAGGVAIIKVIYTKPGKVTLTPIIAGAYSNAYNSDGVVSVANSSFGFPTVPGTGIYQTTAAGVTLTASSDGLGNDQSVAAMGSSAANSITLTATITDSLGRWIPATTANVTLERVSGSSTTLPSTMTASATDGKVSFVVRGSSTPGLDVYRVAANLTSTVTSNQVNLYVQDSAPSAVGVAAVRGVQNGIPGRLDYVTPEDTGLEIELLPLTNQKWVQIKVYPENSGTPIYSSGAIDISTVAPKVTVPKSSLPNGVNRYQVVVRNGYGDSARSVATNAVVNANYSTSISITSTRYDATSKQLYVYGSGFSTSDTINTGLLNIVDANTSNTVNLSGALVSITSWGQFTLNLSSLTTVTGNLENPTKFSGSDINLSAGAVWLTRNDGQVAAADLTGNPTTPGARIDYAIYDRPNSRLYLYGDGFNTGNFDYRKLKLTVSGGTEFTLDGMGPTRNSDTLLSFSLNSTVIQALDANGGYVVTAIDGWFVDQNAARPSIATIPIYAQISLSSVTYSGGKITIKGSGFTGGSIAQANLSIVDLSSTQTLPLTSASPSVVSDDTLELTLSAGDQTTFETTSNFSGDDIYLQGNTGWFTNAQARNSASVPVRAMRFPTR